MQINQRHLDFLQESREHFSKEITCHTYNNGEFIALRRGLDRDCVQIFILGEEIGFFAQMMDKSKLPGESAYER